MTNEYAKLPWSVEDTIENLKEIKEYLKRTVKRTNLHGKCEEDAKEIDFDFDRAINALEKQIPKKQKSIYDNTSYFKLSKAGFLCCSATNKDIRYPVISLEDLEYCPRCGQKLDWGG